MSPFLPRVSKYFPSESLDQHKRPLHVGIRGWRIVTKTNSARDKEIDRGRGRKQSDTRSRHPCSTPDRLPIHETYNAMKMEKGTREKNNCEYLRST